MVIKKNTLWKVTFMSFIISVADFVFCFFCFTFRDVWFLSCNALSEKDLFVEYNEIDLLPFPYLCKLANCDFSKQLAINIFKL